VGLMDTIKGWLHSTNAKADEATQKHRDAGEVPTNAAEVDSEPASEELGTTDAWAPHGRELRESAGSLTGQRNHPWQSGDSTSGQEKRRRLRSRLAACSPVAGSPPGSANSRLAARPSRMFRVCAGANRWFLESSRLALGRTRPSSFRCSCRSRSRQHDPWGVRVGSPNCGNPTSADPLAAHRHVHRAVSRPRQGRQHDFLGTDHQQSNQHRLHPLATRRAESASSH